MPGSETRNSTRWLLSHMPAPRGGIEKVRRLLQERHFAVYWSRECTGASHWPWRPERKEDVLHEGHREGEVGALLERVCVCVRLNEMHAQGEVVRRHTCPTRSGRPGTVPQDASVSTLSCAVLTSGLPISVVCSDGLFTAVSCSWAHASFTLRPRWATAWAFLSSLRAPSMLAFPRKLWLSCAWPGSTWLVTCLFPGDSYANHVRTLARGCWMWALAFHKQGSRCPGQSTCPSQGGCENLMLAEIPPGRW